MSIKQHMLISGAALGALVAGPAFAQDTAPQGAGYSAQSTTPPSGDGASPAAPEQANRALEEVIVTANKREENLQKVPATVVAVNQDELARQGVKDITDIAKVVPEVRVQEGPFTNINIRGIRTGAYSPTTDSPNAVHLDGAYVSRFTSLQGLFFDMQRVEVLAGPQGTLYGRNSAGGTINIITNKPTMDDVHAEGSLEYGNYNAFTANAAINIPLSDTLAVRGAYYRFSHRGYANNGLNDAELNSGRISLLWQPTSSDSLLITADRQLAGGKGAIGQGNQGGTITKVYKSPSILISPTGSASVVEAGTPGSFIVPIVPATGPYDVRSRYGNADSNQQDTRGSGVMAQYDHEFDWATLTGQASYRTTQSDNPTGTLTGIVQDPLLLTTRVMLPSVGAFSPATNGFQTAHARWDSQELRLTSPSNQQLTWVLGLYHFHEKSYDNHVGTYASTLPNSGYGTPQSTIGQFYINNPQVVNLDIGNDLQVNHAYAAFGQATWSPEFLEGLHVTGGLRYNYEEKHSIANTVLGGVDCAGGCYDSEADWSEVTYKANMAYDISPTNTIYLDHSTGFKSGGFSYGLNAQYEPETIEAYEFGSKNRFFDDRLQVNLSVWHYDYSNIVTNIGQPYIDATLPPPGIAFTITSANGRRAEVDGQSLSILAQPTQDDTFSFNATHLKARYTDYDIHALYQLPIGPGGSLVYLTPGATDATYDYSNTLIGFTPDWAFTATYNHSFHVFGGTLDAQAAVQYTGRRLLAGQASKAVLNEYVMANRYATADFSLRYSPDGTRWAITGYVRNLTDHAPLLQRQHVSNNNFLPVSDPRVLYAYEVANYGPPRTYGMSLSFDF